VIVNFVDPDHKFARAKTPRRIQVDEPMDGMASQRRLSEWFHLLSSCWQRKADRDLGGLTPPVPSSQTID